MPLTPKQSHFVAEYLVDLNATQAAIRAGYSAKTASSQGERLLRNVEIASAIEKARDARLERTEVTADYVLRRLVQIDQMDVADILNEHGGVKPIQDWPPVWRQFVSGMEVSDLFEGYGDEREMVGLLKKIKWPDKLRNLELLGKHIAVGAFKEKHEHTGKDGGPIETVTRVERVIVKPSDSNS